MAVEIPVLRAPSGGSGLSLAGPLAVRVLPFDDVRPDLDVEGRTVAAFGVPMASIRFDPGPATLLGQIVRSELLAAGHPVVERTQHSAISGMVRAFEIQTDTTALYWDVIGNLAVSLQTRSAQAAGPQALFDYRARCKDRTYAWPSQAVINQVMGRCIADFANQLRNDGRMAAALRAVPDRAATAVSGQAEGQTGTMAALAAGANEKSYTHAAPRWSVQYPDDWRLDASGPFAKFSKGSAVLGIHTAPYVAGTSLDEVADAAIRDWEHQMKSVNVVRRVTRRHMMLSGDVAAIAITHHLGAGEAGKSRKVIAVIKDRRFVIDAETYRTAWPDYERDFGRIIATFRVQE